LQLEPELDVLPRRPPRQQTGLLKDEAAVAPGAGDDVSVDQNAAGVEPHQALDDPQQRGLAAAAFPDERDDLVIADIECQVPQDRQQRIAAVVLAAHPKRLRDVPHTEFGRTQPAHNPAHLTMSAAWGPGASSALTCSPAA
jgi:hypothetical protein